MNNGGKKTVNSKVWSSGWCDWSNTLPVTTIILPVATGSVLLSVLTLSSTPVASSSTTLSIATGCRSLYNFYRTLLLATGCLFLQNVGFQFRQPSCRYEPPVPSCFSRVCFYQNLCKLWLKLLVILYFFKLSEKRSWVKEQKMIDVKKIEEENIIFYNSALNVHFSATFIVCSTGFFFQSLDISEIF